MQALATKISCFAAKPEFSVSFFPQLCQNQHHKKVAAK
jgi:hypothetical protein